MAKWGEGEFCKNLENQLRKKMKILEISSCERFNNSGTF